MKQGDKFYITLRPKNKKYYHLYGRKLTVGINWANGDVTPYEEFVNIPKEYISETPPHRLEFTLCEKIKRLINNLILHYR